jgi:hypothetical protein
MQRTVNGPYLFPTKILVSLTVFVVAYGQSKRMLTKMSSIFKGLNMLRKGWPNGTFSN